MPYDNPVTKHCETCGGENVKANAYAEWNPELQTWELVAIFDNTDCHDCGGQCHLVDRKVTL